MAGFARKFRSQFTGFAQVGGKTMRVTQGWRDKSDRPHDSACSRCVPHL